MLHDEDIREPLFDFLEETYGKIRIIEEKTIGRSRADVVMVTESALYGLEIKSDADSYTRLARQVKDYDRYYDFNYVVIGTSHAMHIREHVPDYWGVITVEEVEGRADFYIWHKPAPNPKRMLECKLGILWRPELALLQELHAMPKYKERKKEFVIGKIIEQTRYDPDQKGYIEKSVLDREISDILMERDYTNVTEQLREYRKGEIQKQLEKEEDPQKRLQLMIEQAEKGRIATRNGFKKSRRRRKRSGRIKLT